MFRLVQVARIATTFVRVPKSFNRYRGPRNPSKAKQRRHLSYFLVSNLVHEPLIPGVGILSSRPLHSHISRSVACNPLPLCVTPPSHHLDREYESKGVPTFFWLLVYRAKAITLCYTLRIVRIGVGGGWGLGGGISIDVD